MCVSDRKFCLFVQYTTTYVCVCVPCNIYTGKIPVKLIEKKVTLTLFSGGKFMPVVI